MDGYEYIDHTADLGMRAYGKTLKELFINAAQGMLEAMAETETIHEVQQIQINVAAESLEDLMVAWLDELIFRYEVEEVLFRCVKIQQINEKELSAIAYGESPDLTKHVVYTEIKSVTYHQLVVEQKSNGDWFAQVIFDL